MRVKADSTSGLLIIEFTINYRVVQKKGDHHAVWEYNLHKLLLNNGFILL